MATQTRYAYEAINAATDTLVKDVVSAASEQEARATLHANGLRPLKVAPEKSKANFTIPGTGGPKMNHRALAEFTRMLARMIRTGASKVETMSILAEEATKKANVAMLVDIGGRITGGDSLAEAFGAYPRVFDAVFLGYLAAGESTGTLGDTVDDLARMLDKKSKMRGKVMGAMKPAKWNGAMIGVMVVGILLFLVPMFEGIYKSMGSQLPVPTQILVTVSHHLLPVTFGGPLFIIPQPFSATAIVGLLAAGVWYFRRRYKGNPEVWNVVTRITYRMPVFGPLAREWALYGWVTTMGGALRARLPVARALELASQASGSAWIAYITKDREHDGTTTRGLISTVLSGDALWVAMAGHKDLFKSTTRASLRIGEQTARLPEALADEADDYSESLDRRVEGMKAAIEPLFMMAMGVVVGPIIIALYLPIINMGSTMMKGLGH